jgi:hypothetical protein
MEVSSSHISILPTEVFEHSTEVKTNPSSSGGGGVSQAGAQRGVLHVSRREAARRASRRKAGAALCASQRGGALRERMRGYARARTSGTGQRE